MINDRETLINNTWASFKPAKSGITYYFKNTLNKNVTLLFTKKWLVRHPEIAKKPKLSKFYFFFKFRYRRHHPLR